MHLEFRIAPHDVMYPLHFRRPQQLACSRGESMSHKAGDCVASLILGRYRV